MIDNQQRPLRVLQFITPAGFYGAERWVLALANNIDHDNVICDLAVTRESPNQDLTVAEVYPQAQGQQVHYLNMKGRFDFGAVKQLCTVIRERRIDVVHTHGYKSDILGLLAAKKTGIASVSTPHGFPDNVSFKMALFIKLGTFALRYFDKVVPLSEELQAEMERFGVPSHKTDFIRNGVDLKEIDLALQELKDAAETPVPCDKASSCRIGYIGQIIPRKGIKDLISVFNTLHKTNTGLTLELIGDGGQRAELESFAKTLPSASAIHFAGFRSDRLALLSTLDLFAMTSSLEGIPRCMMEAMAVGVPVVAYDIPGVDQLVTHEETGLLAPLGDKEALVACFQRLLDNPELAQNLATAAKARVLEKFSAERMAKEYEALFRELLLKHQPEPEPGKTEVTH